MINYAQEVTVMQEVLQFSITIYIKWLKRNLHPSLFWLFVKIDKYVRDNIRCNEGLHKKHNFSDFCLKGRAGVRAVL